MWIRTQTNRPNEDLVNLDQVVAIEQGYHDGAHAVVAYLRTNGKQREKQTLTYFDGPAAERLAQRALIALWGEMQIGVKFIDMADVCELALEESV